MSVAMKPTRSTGFSSAHLRRAAGVDDDQLGIAVERVEGVDDRDQQRDREDDRDQHRDQQRRDLKEGGDRLAVGGDQIELAERLA